jgi:hypothetical protein
MNAGLLSRLRLGMPGALHTPAQDVEGVLLFAPFLAPRLYLFFMRMFGGSVLFCPGLIFARHEIAPSGEVQKRINSLSAYYKVHYTAKSRSGNTEQIWHFDRSRTDSSVAECSRNDSPLRCI